MIHLCIILIYAKLVIEREWDDMKKQSVISLAILMLLITGCSRNENKSNSIPGKAIISDEVLEILNTSTKDTSKSEEKADTSDDSTDNSNSDTSSDKESVSEKKQSENKGSSQQANSSQNSTSNSNSSSSSGNSGNGSTQQPSQPVQPPKQDQTPSTPAIPEVTEPSKPTCNDTIPAGAYQIEREDEIAKQVEAEMMDKLLNGDGTFTQYEIEYGYTGCGRKYFYIIRIYS